MNNLVTSRQPEEEGFGNKHIKMSNKYKRTRSQIRDDKTRKRKSIRTAKGSASRQHGMLSPPGSPQQEAARESCPPPDVHPQKDDNQPTEWVPSLAIGDSLGDRGISVVERARRRVAQAEALYKEMEREQPGTTTAILGYLKRAREEYRRRRDEPEDV